MEEIYLVEQLEQRFCWEVASYQHYTSDYMGAPKFDKNYFPKFISENLMLEFKQWIYDKVNKYNNFEINKYLTLSLGQFETNKPEARKEFLLRMYYIAYWHPNTVPKEEIEDHYSNFFLYAFRSYNRYFETFKSITEKTLTDFKAGLLGNTGTFQTTPIEQQKVKVQYRDYKHFLKHLEYNYPYETTTMHYIYQLKDDIKHLKKEILDNLINLTQEEKIPYLNRLKVELEPNTENIFAKKEDLLNWTEKYQISLEQIFAHQDTNNELYKILISQPPSFKDTFEDGFNKDTEQIQRDFYNYFYGSELNNALEFIDEQINLMKPGTTESSKMKTNLSVPELAFLFQQLSELKPEIFDVKSKAELHRFISNSFTTKGSDEISTNKLKILFGEPDAKAASFWTKHFSTLLSKSQKIK
ncbi:MAG: hypothetical protein U0W24_18625 [Bacteroidales bacterium]